MTLASSSTGGRDDSNHGVFSVVRSGVLAFGIGLATLAIPQLLDIANAETPDATPTSAASTSDAARATAAARPAGPKARVTRAGRAAAPVVTSVPTPRAPTASSTPASAFTPLAARPRYRMLDDPAAASPRPGETVLRGVDGTYVSFYNRTDRTLAVVQVPKGGRNDPEADPRYVGPGEKFDFSGDNNGAGNVDVRLRVYSATQNDTGAWQKDGMREIIIATNQWIGRPYVVVHLDQERLDTIRSGYEVYNRRLYAPFNRPWWDTGGTLGFKEGEAWFADYDLRGPYQGGQTGTYVLRLNDKDAFGVEGYKVFQIEVFTIPSNYTQDYDYSTEIGAGRVNQK